jgi:hypothetical protein
LRYLLRNEWLENCKNYNRHFSILLISIDFSLRPSWHKW